MRGSDRYSNSYTAGQLAIRDMMRGMGLSPDLEVPFDPYVADIYCVGAHISVEFDGDGHWKKKDAKRDKYLWDNYKLPVLRISDVSNEEKTKQIIMDFVFEWKDSAKKRRDTLW